MQQEQFLLRDSNEKGKTHKRLDNSKSSRLNLKRKDKKICVLKGLRSVICSLEEKKPFFNLSKKLEGFSVFAV